MPRFRELEGVRGGFRKPGKVSDFILEWLGTKGEDIISNMHQEYSGGLIVKGVVIQDDWLIRKAEDKYAGSRNKREGRFWQEEDGTWRGIPYRKTTYQSFKVAVENLIRVGLVEKSRQEESDDIRFVNWDPKPLRNYYRLTGTTIPKIEIKKPQPPGPLPEKVSITRQGNPREKPLQGRGKTKIEKPIEGRRKKR